MVLLNVAGRARVGLDLRNNWWGELGHHGILSPSVISVALRASFYSPFLIDTSASGPVGWKQDQKQLWKDVLQSRNSPAPTLPAPNSPGENSGPRRPISSAVGRGSEQHCTTWLLPTFLQTGGRGSSRKRWEMLRQNTESCIHIWINLTFILALFIRSLNVYWMLLHSQPYFRSWRYNSEPNKLRRPKKVNEQGNVLYCRPW